MKRLYLLRHADSGLAKSGQDDFDRALSQYGRHAATRMGQYMTEREYIPAIAHCSPALRTRETWSCIAAGLDTQPAGEFPAGLYLPEPQTMLDTVRATANKWESAIVVSHNPGMLALALGLSGSEVRAANPFGEYPAAALAVFDFPVDTWLDINPGGGALIEYTRAENLPQAG